MTCIVGIRTGRRVLIGGDSAGVSGYEVSIRRDPKVARLPGYVIGFTTSFRMGQLLHHAFKPPAPPKRDLFRFMVTQFVDSLRDCLKVNGWATTSAGQEVGGTFLVGCQGHLFRIDNDYQVGETACGYDAVGCGAELARGALYAGGRAGFLPMYRARIALEAAAFGNSGVRAPFRFVSL